MRLDSCEGRVLTSDGNVPRPEGRDERRVEGRDFTKFETREDRDPTVCAIVDGKS